MDHSGQQGDTAGLMRRRKWYRYQVQERGDAEQYLDVGHCKGRGRHALRQRGQDGPQRRVQCRRIHEPGGDVGRDCLSLALAR